MDTLSLKPEYAFVNLLHHEYFNRPESIYTFLWDLDRCVFVCIPFCSLCYASQLFFLLYTYCFTEKKWQEFGVKKICVSEHRKLHWHIWVASQGSIQQECSHPKVALFYLTTLWASLADCPRLFKLWSEQETIFINLTSLSFFVFTVSLGFPPEEPLARPGLPPSGLCRGPAPSRWPGGRPAVPQRALGSLGPWVPCPCYRAGCPALWSCEAGVDTQDRDPLMLWVWSGWEAASGSCIPWSLLRHRGHGSTGALLPHLSYIVLAPAGNTVFLGYGEAWSRVGGA